LWRSARADLRSLEGRHDEATRLAADAVDIADRTDMTELQAEARVTAAEVARARGDDTTAAAFGAEALALFERKGNEVRAAELRGWLGSA
jgi:hypothetical protein